MDIKPAFYIISAARADASNNVARHAALKPAVQRLGAVKHVHGCFNGDKEHSWLVIANPLSNQAHLETIQHLLVLYSQQCALFVDSNRGAWYVYPDKPNEYQGIWTSIQHSDPADSYTIDPTTGYVYGIK